MVSDTLSPNLPVSIVRIITVAGLNFDQVDLTATAQLALGACGTVAWLSGTALACFASTVSPPADASAVVTVSAGLVGTAGAAFTFDGAPSFLISRASAQFGTRDRLGCWDVPPCLNVPPPQRQWSARAAR